MSADGLPQVLYGGNDVFDRQRVGELGQVWKHDLIEQQVALVLGAGGVGSGVAMALCRLGIRKLFILDFDDVDPTNLNRQVLCQALRRRGPATLLSLLRRAVGQDTLPCPPPPPPGGAIRTLSLFFFLLWHPLSDVTRSADPGIA